MSWWITCFPNDWCNSAHIVFWSVWLQDKKGWAVSLVWWHDGHIWLIDALLMWYRSWSGSHSCTNLVRICFSKALNQDSASWIVGQWIIASSGICHSNLFSRYSKYVVLVAASCSVAWRHWIWIWPLTLKCGYPPFVIGFVCSWVSSLWGVTICVHVSHSMLSFSSNVSGLSNLVSWCPHMWCSCMWIGWRAAIVFCNSAYTGQSSWIASLGYGLFDFPQHGQALPCYCNICGLFLGFSWSLGGIHSTGERSLMPYTSCRLLQGPSTCHCGMLVHDPPHSIVLSLPI